MAEGTSVGAIAALLDEVRGQVAALIALSATQPGLDASRIKAAQGLIGSLVGAAQTKRPENSPLTHAQETLAKIESVARSLEAVRSSGEAGKP